MGNEDKGAWRRVGGCAGPLDPVLSPCTLTYGWLLFSQRSSLCLADSFSMLPLLSTHVFPTQDTEKALAPESCIPIFLFAE